MQASSSLDTDELDRSGIELGATGRLQLMYKLAEGTGLEIPNNAAIAAPQNAPTTAPPIATQCFMLSNMLDPQNESNTNWASFSGTAKISQDREKIAKHWSPVYAPFLRFLSQ